MSVAAALATALTMAVARDATRPWLPSLFAAAALGATLTQLAPTPQELAQLVLLATSVAFAGTVGILLRGTAVRGATLANASLRR
jgi:hypothetical protein